jgi:hypothetical protein
MPEEVVETTGQDTTAIVETSEPAAAAEPEVVEDFDSTEEEFRSLFQRCDDEAASMKQLAMQIQPSAPQAAEALRQVAGNVYPLMQEVIATCGGAFQAIDDEDEQPGEGLSDEDALDFARTLMANTKMITELREAATDDAIRGRLDAMATMNNEMHARILELAEMTQEDLDKALAEAEAAPEQPAGEVN